MAFVGLGLAILSASVGQAKDIAKAAAPPTLFELPDGRVASELAALAPQRPGHPDLFVLAVAGDGSEQVFLNEVLHLENLAARRLDAAGHVLVLANHEQPPLARRRAAASPANLRAALAGLGAAMDPAEDLLLLYFTTHGTEQHELLLRRNLQPDYLMRPAELRAALDASGIRHRLLVISACYSGGFVRSLRDPDTLVLTAAHRDRSSFGCSPDAAATFFGRAWLVDGLNHTSDLVEAFELATAAIDSRERARGLLPSEPQIHRGSRIAARLAAWRAAFTPGPALPYPYEDSGEDDAGAALIPPLKPAGKSLKQ